MRPIKVPDPKDRNARKELQRLIDRIIRTATPRSVGDGWVAEAGHHDRPNHPATEVMFADGWRLVFENDGTVNIIDDDHAKKPKPRMLRGGWKAGVRMTVRHFHREVKALERESGRCRSQLWEFENDLY